MEEPVTSDDRIGLRLVLERAPTVMEIAAGEYIYVLEDAKNLIQAECISVLQADVTRCGGISNFLKIGALCELSHFPYSAHTAPSLHASLACSLIGVMNVEYFHDHARVEEMLFEGAIRPVKGNLKPDLSQQGLGLKLKRADAAKFQTFSADVAIANEWSGED